MNKLLAIFKKELKGFFYNPNFLIVCGICTIVLSFKYAERLFLFSQELTQRSFQGGGMNQKYMNIHYGVFLSHLSILNLILIFAVPALTMRLIAEEKKMRTFDLLLTSPVTSAQIVVGKYFAALAAIFGIMLLALAYPLVTRFFGAYNMGMLLISTLGIFLVAAVYAAMNLFCSALTESAIVAYVMAVILNVSVWLMGSVSELVDSATVRQVLEQASMNQHLVGMIEGVTRTSSLVFFASVIFFFVFLTERVVEATRWR
jgi:ABC-2 type transport system permease protein